MKIFFEFFSLEMCSSENFSSENFASENFASENFASENFGSEILASENFCLGKFLLPCRPSSSHSRPSSSLPPPFPSSSLPFLLHPAPLSSYLSPATWPPETPRPVPDTWSVRIIAQWKTLQKRPKALADPDHRRKSSYQDLTQASTSSIFASSTDCRMADKGMLLFRCIPSRGSFSAVSTPIFASKYSLESSRRDLHNALLCTGLEAQFLAKIFGEIFEAPSDFLRLSFILYL